MIRLALVGLAALALAAPPAAAAARPFAPDSPWNAGLRANAPLSPSGGAGVAWLLRIVETRPLWLNSARCGMPVYRAAPRQRRVRVRLARSAYQDPALRRALRAVPIPADAEPANCSDRNLAVTQRRRGGRVTQWELWRAQRTRRGWVAGWAGVIRDIRRDRGFASPLQWRDRRARRYVARQASVKWNVTASSASMTAGVITARDLRRGRIDHALALALPDVARGMWVWPAQRTDGGANGPDALPMGSRLRLDPSLDLRRLSLPPLVRMMAEAAQRYGIIVRDRTWSSTAFYTEQLSSAGAQRLHALLGGSPDRVLRRFPGPRCRCCARPAARTGTGASCTTARASTSTVRRWPARRCCSTRATRSSTSRAARCAGTSTETAAMRRGRALG